MESSHSSRADTSCYQADDPARVYSVFECTDFFESATYDSDIVAELKNSFDRIYSIELSRELFEKAEHQFRHDNHNELVQRDSGVQLKYILGLSWRRDACRVLIF